jgi:hypothetical protein
MVRHVELVPVPVPEGLAGGAVQSEYFGTCPKMLVPDRRRPHSAGLFWDLFQQTVPRPAGVGDRFLLQSLDLDIAIPSLDVQLIENGILDAVAEDIGR